MIPCLGDVLLLICLKDICKISLCKNHKTTIDSGYFMEYAVQMNIAMILIQMCNMSL